MSAKRTKSAGAADPASAAASQAPAPQRVCFEYRNAGARRVCLAGTFNDWHPDKLEMIQLDGGRWAKELMLPPGTYEYQFVVDGQWLTDPAATETIAHPFGGHNSIRKVTPPSGTGRPATAGG